MVDSGRSREESEGIIQHKKETTNKFLSYNWNELNYREQVYFNNDQSLFLKKKSLLIENAQLTSLLKSLHAKLKLLSEGDEMQNTAEELVKLDKQRAENWQEIDNF